MDLSTMIVDMLRGDDFEKNFPESVRPAKSPTAVNPARASEMAAAAAHLADPLYTAYKREALSSGEPVLSPEEFKVAKAEGRL